MDYPGKVITKNQVTPSQTSASGVWTVDDAAAAVENNSWPVAGVPNPISRSLRFNSADSAYLNRTPATASNRKTWTWSGWVKRSALGSAQQMFGASSSEYDTIGFDSSDRLRIYIYNATISTIRVSSQVFRDVGAWYHILVAFDSTNGTDQNRCRVYVNGSEITAWSTNNSITLNLDTSINNNVIHYVGRYGVSGGPEYFNGYLTEINFIDGQALTPASFGMADPVTGAWIPKAYNGTYGTNGFYLNFSNNSSTAALGTDYSGNSNTWTTNNFSVTAGAGNDSLTDVPTPWIAYNTTGDVGGVVRGNYATLNPLNSSSFSTLSDGNLRSFGNTATNSGLRASTFPATTGKIVWEQTATTVSGNFPELGCVSLIPNDGNGLNLAGSSTLGVQYRSNGVINKNNAVSVGTFSTISSGDVVRFELDVDALTCAIYKNNSLITTVTGLTAGVFYPAVVDYNGSVTNTNFGQRPFAYTAPSGFKTLVTTNLPEPTIKDGSEHFDILLYTGDGTTSKNVTGLSFQPDMVYVKNRSAASDPTFSDVVRGITKVLYTDTTAAESTAPVFGYINSVLLNGINVNSGGSTEANFNKNTQAYVAWNWKANGAGVSNTAGTITSTVSVNTTSGFSIVTYTGTGSAGTVGHGLGVAPGMIIVKARSSAVAWQSFHQSLGKDRTLQLNETDTGNTVTDYWGTSAPNSTVFGVIGGGYDNNLSGVTTVAYCFAPISGFSSMGSYVGNGSADGPMIFTGFRPAFVIRRCSSATGNWFVNDATRDPYNVALLRLNADTSDAESSGANSEIDFLANGFKIRATSSAGVNQSGQTHIYIAFAENPFSIALAR